MTDSPPFDDPGLLNQETRDWIESFEDVLDLDGTLRAGEILSALQVRAQEAGISAPVHATTPSINTIPVEHEPPYPGDRDIERRLKSWIRWNAMAMVVRANTAEEGIGGHISTYASSATLYEVGFNHFFRGKDDSSGGDLVYFQGHASPGIYARAFLEGRLTEKQLDNFRRELAPGGGLSSYPHPYLMPDFWEYPTVSLGLGPMQALYRARFMRYLENRGFKEPSDAKVWCFIGDGETDEPETLGSISMAARKQLDNLIFVINCNLQRLDGPVRGNGRIIHELEAMFRGVGWNVIKVLWGSDWDPILAGDEDGFLVEALTKVRDGQRQTYRSRGGAYVREHFWNKDPRLAKMVEHLSDDELFKLRLGGHDQRKVHAAYRMAMDTKDMPTVILAHTVKGYGLGDAGEAMNVTHSKKKLTEEQLRKFRDRFDIPVDDTEIANAPYYLPPTDCPEMEYMRERQRELGGPVPERRRSFCALSAPAPSLFEEFHEGTGERPVSTTMAFARMLAKMLKDENIGKHIVPIIADEARTFGMDALFSQVGIYSGVGMQYEPVDSSSLMHYREATDGQILQEGITEAGSICSFIAAGTSHTVHGTCMIPIYPFYSMFGFQRVGDFIWAASDVRARGFLIGATAGRTTLAGEGLQHQDGHSHLLALSNPSVLAYDPAFAYEIAVIVEEGVRRMYVEDENCFYYITVSNENYVQPPMPEADGLHEGILRGLYRFRQGENEGQARVQLLASGIALNLCLEASELLAKYGVDADLWSVTSWKRLHEEANEAERWNLRHPEETPRRSHLEECLENTDGPFVAVSDYVKALPDLLHRWIPGPLVSLGTDGFGRSDGRAALRDFFEIDAKHIAYSAIAALARQGRVEPELAWRALEELEIDPDKPEPRHG